MRYCSLSVTQVSKYAKGNETYLAAAERMNTVSRDSSKLVLFAILVSSVPSLHRSNTIIFAGQLESRGTGQKRKEKRLRGKGAKSQRSRMREAGAALAPHLAQTESASSPRSKTRSKREESEEKSMLEHRLNCTV